MNNQELHSFPTRRSSDLNSQGQINLGLCYENAIGVNKDEKKTFEWYLKSAECGNSNGQCNIGLCYESGLGITKDKSKALDRKSTRLNSSHVSISYAVFCL